MTDAAAVAAAAAAANEGERKYGGEFATVEELEAAYAASKSTVTEPAKTGDLAIKPGEGEEGTKEGEVASALAAVGLDQAVFTKEFAETGALSDDSMKALETKGFPRAMVEVYLSGLRADQTAYEATLYAPAGGKEGYTELLKWAGKNLPEADIDAFNATISSGNAAQAKLAVAGLFAAKNQGKAVLLNGKTTVTDGVTPYQSQAQVRAAINDPRYRSDPAYRRAHEARLAVSNY